MGKISLADVARALDAMIDSQMTAQARITAHLVAAAEPAGHDAARLIETLDDVAANTVVDEFWISDEQGVVYITTVRDASGAPMPFRFDPDPAVQPQASAFHVLLASSVDSDDVVTQEAQVREIDHGVYKYAGVSGVDRQRIVQVGNGLAFEEQVSRSNAYASPVMTSVLAAFDVPELLSDTYTSEYGEIRPIFEEILGRQMIVQAALVERFAAAAEEAGWSTDGSTAVCGASCGPPPSARFTSSAATAACSAPACSRSRTSCRTPVTLGRRRMARSKPWTSRRHRARRTAPCTSTSRPPPRAHRGSCR